MVIVLLVVTGLFGARAYGFLPTVMNTSVWLPAETPNGPFNSCCEGTIPFASPIFSAIPARRYDGNKGGGIAIVAAGLATSTCTSTPDCVLGATVNPGATVRIIGLSSGGFTRVHPAAVKVLSICLSKSRDSWSEYTPVKVYVVPRNSPKLAIKSEVLLIDLGVRIRSSSASALVASLNASARCCSAVVAALVADTIRWSKESASFRAPLASFWAPADEIVAASDCSLAVRAASDAADAASLALSAFRWASPKSNSSNVWSIPLASWSYISKTPSAATPSTTTSQPISASFLTHLPPKYGKVIGHNSWNISGPSMRHPMATTIADAATQKKN